VVCAEVNNTNICTLAERNSMQMAQLEARYKRSWARRNKGRDNCLIRHARSNEVSCKYAIRAFIQTSLLPTDSKFRVLRTDEMNATMLVAPYMQPFYYTSYPSTEQVREPIHRS
jgi:hypothetical protein